MTTPQDEIHNLRESLLTIATQCEMVASEKTLTTAEKKAWSSVARLARKGLKTPKASVSVFEPIQHCHE